MSLGMPTLQAGETFGMAVNFGQLKQSSALGFSAMGLSNKDLFGGGERLALNAAFGFSTQDKTIGGRKSSNVTGARVGLQLSW